MVVADGDSVITNVAMITLAMITRATTSFQPVSGRLVSSLRVACFCVEERFHGKLGQKSFGIDVFPCQRGLAVTKFVASAGASAHRRSQ
jgi:hypothetical protein